MNSSLSKTRPCTSLLAWLIATTTLLPCCGGGSQTTPGTDGGSGGGGSGGGAPGDGAVPDRGRDSASGDAGPTGTVGRVVGPPGPYAWKNVSIVGGGYVPAVVFSPVEKDLIYLRTDMGGAYRWDASSKVWIPLTDWVGFDDWNYLGIESIAADPKDANRVYIVAGTYTNSWTAMNGQLLRSNDRGDSFDRFNLPFKVGGNMPGRNMGERLAVDPSDNRIIYLGARSGKGLWRSTDAGETWSQVSSFPSVGDYVQDPSNEYTADIIGVAWIAFDPKSSNAGGPSQTIYVGVADTKIAVFRSTDGGVTWAAVPGQPADGFLPHHGVLASNGVLYITYSDKGGPYDGGKGDVWKYDTKTSSWTLISPVPSTDTSNDYFGYGGLAVDAQHPDTLVVSSLNSWWPDARFYRSVDGGTTWKPIWDYAGYPTRVNRYLLDITAAPWLDWAATKTAPEESPKLGWMTGGIHIDPFDSNRMMYGTGATLYGTNDLTSWDDAAKQIQITVFAQGIEETAVLDLAAPPSGAVLLSALGDICGFYHSDLTKTPAAIMTQPTFTSTSSIDFAESNPKLVVRVGSHDAADTANKGIGLSSDGGKTWSNGGDAVTGAQSGTVAVGADGEYTVWAPASPSGTGVYYARYSAYSWTASTGIPAAAEVRSDRVNRTKFYGFKDGKFYVSSDGGATFTASQATGLPKSGHFRTVFGNEGDIWLAGGSTNSGDVYGLWHSTDSGATFTKVAGIEQADVVGFGKAAEGRSYPAIYANAKVGGVRGLFRSDDGGATFLRINDDMHQYGAANTVITGDRNIYGRVYLGTNGRGIIYGDIK